MNTDNTARGEKLKPEKTSTLTPLINTGTFLSREEWQALHRQHLELTNSSDCDILLLGDSILYGWQWPGRPQIWKRHFDQHKTLNFAISGDYIQHLLWRVENGTIDKLSPDLIILLIGANNLDEYTEKEISKGVMKLLNRLKRLCPASRLILTGLFPRGAEANTPVRHKIISINKILENLADGERIYFHNPGELLLETDGSMSRKMFYDFSHPNIAGYAKWAELLEEFISRISGST
jgi:lysophospholipase L1-like esterase